MANGKPGEFQPWPNSRKFPVFKTQFPQPPHKMRASMFKRGKEKKYSDGRLGFRTTVPSYRSPKLYPTDYPISPATILICYSYKRIGGEVSEICYSWKELAEKYQKSV